MIVPVLKKKGFRRPIPSLVLHIGIYKPGLRKHAVLTNVNY